MLLYYFYYYYFIITIIIIIFDKNPGVIPPSLTSYIHPGCFCKWSDGILNVMIRWVRSFEHWCFSGFLKQSGCKQEYRAVIRQKYLDIAILMNPVDN